MIQNGAVPAITYRMRTKGSQWLWLQSRFQMLTHQFSMKPYAILSYNQVITLNEMFESRDMFDNTENSTFFSSCETTAADTTTTTTDSSSSSLGQLFTNNEIEMSSSSASLSSMAAVNSEAFGYKKTNSETTLNDSKSNLNESDSPTQINGSDRKIDESLEVNSLISTIMKIIRNVSL